MAAGPLLVIVDEDIIPSEGANVERIKSAENPQERNTNKRCQEDVDAPIQSTNAGLILLRLYFFLNFGKSVPIHLEMDIKALSLVFPSLDCPGDCEEPIV